MSAPQSKRRPRWSEMRICERAECGKSFRVTASVRHQRFCGRLCAVTVRGEQMRGENHPRARPSEPKALPSCVACGSTHLQRCGRDQHDRQRWRCAGCGRTSVYVRSRTA